MLIKIDRSLVENLNNELTYPLSLLAIAQSEGKHIITGDRNTLQSIIKCDFLDDPTKQIYKKILDKVSYLPSYLSAVSRYIEVINDCPEPRILESSGKKVIQVSPKFFNDSETIQKTIILAENINDSFFYEIIATVYLIWKELRASIAYEKRGGGGSTITGNYIEIQRSNKRLCLCLVDSDRLAPQSSLGSTAQSIQRQADSRCTRTQLFILNFREIENLIPTSILSELPLIKSKNAQEALEVIQAIDRSSVQEIRGFLDIKHKMVFQSVIKNKEDNVKEFWQDKIDEISQISDIRIDSWCQEHWSCSKPNPCNCSIFPGFGDGVLEQTIEHLKGIAPQQIAKKIKEGNPLRREWEKLGEAVVNWCLADQPIRA